MQLSAILAFATVAFSAVLGVSAEAKEQAAHETTLWVPTATVVETNTFTATRVEEIWTTVSPYDWLTTYPVTWTAVETKTEYAPVVTTVERRHVRDFQ